MEIQRLKESILTIGRTLPLGMECHFDRVEEDLRVRMQIVSPDGSCTEYAFVNSNPLPTFPLATLLRECHPEQALRELLATIELHTDCMDGRIDSEPLQPYVDKAEQLLAEGWISEQLASDGGVISGLNRTTSGAIGQP